MIKLNIPNYTHGAHAFYYVPRRQDETNLSMWIIQMKSGKHPQMESKFSEIVINHINESNLKFDYLVRALGSSETQPNHNAPLQRVGVKIATTLDINFIPQILSKDLTTPMHTIPNKDDRQDNIQNKYKGHLLNGSEISNKNILVIDDVITTQSTAIEIQRALSTVCKNCTFSFLALAKTEELPNINQQFFKSN